MKFGSYVRTRREAMFPDLSLRAFAKQLGVSPTYLSRLETNDVDPPSEEVLLRMAGMLKEHPDAFLALAGKVSGRLQAIILKQPKAFAALLQQLEDAPEHAILRVVREVRDGDW